MLLLTCLLASLWGVIWALCLDLTSWGQFLAKRRTWLAVVVGVGMDLLILLLVLPLVAWLVVVTVVACSSTGIILRSLRNEHRELEGLIRDLTNAAGE